MKVVAVGDISEQIRGVTYTKSDASAVPRSGYSPILRANNIGEHGLLLGDLIFVPDTNISPKQRIVPNDIVVAASSGSLSVVGKTAQARMGFEGAFGAFCKVLRPGPDVDPHYFGHYFKTSSYRRVVSQLASGANINNLRNEHLDNLAIPLPPLTEQKRIAGILDAADALRVKRREALAQLDALLQSTFLDMFGDPVTNPMGWETEGFETWLDNIDSGWSPKCLNRKALIDEWGILKLGAVTWCEFDESAHKALPPGAAPRPELEVAPGDLLFSRKNTRDLIAAAAYVHKVRPRLMLSDLIFRLRLRSGVAVTSAFLWRLLIQPKQRRFIQRLASGSAGSMPNISKAKLKTLQLIKPPLDLQRRFATIVESVEQQKARQQAHLTELSALFASLQYRAFRGDL